jgi:long-chain fatty acid transport protein
MNKTQSFVSFGLAVSILSASAPAMAGGFAVGRFGGERGHAATDHVTSIFYNPAGLALGDGVRVYGEGILAYRSVDYTRDPRAIDTDPDLGTATPEGAQDRNSGKNTLRNWIAAPFLAAAVEVFDGFSLGLGVYVPFGGQAEWGKDDRFENDQAYPGAYDGSQRWAAIEGSQRAAYGSIAAAWRSPGNRFAVGATFSLVQNTLDLVRARNLNGSDGLVNTDGTIAEGRSHLDVKGVTPAASIGVMANVTPCFRVGLAYQSQPNFGQMTLEGDLTNKFGDASTFAVPVELEQELPDIIRIGAECNAFHKGSLRFSAEYQRWSVFEDQCLIQTGLPGGAVGKCALNADGSHNVEQGGNGVLVYIPRDWNDTFNVRAGGSYYPTDALEVNAGVTFDTNAAPDKTLETALIDANKTIGTIGAVYDLGAVTLEGTIAGVYYQTRTTDVRTEPPVLQRPGRNPDMAGEYKQFVAYAILGLGLEL